MTYERQVLVFLAVLLAAVLLFAWVQPIEREEGAATYDLAKRIVAGGRVELAVRTIATVTDAWCRLSGYGRDE